MSDIAILTDRCKLLLRCKATCEESKKREGKKAAITGAIPQSPLRLKYAMHTVKQCDAVQAVHAVCMD